MSRMRERGAGVGLEIAPSLRLGLALHEGLREDSMNLEGQRVVVMGTKRSGLAACELLCGKGAEVRAIHRDPLPETEEAAFRRLGVRIGIEDEETWDDAPELIVLSPGVAFDLPLLEKARTRGIPIIGEVELASYFLRGPILGITGTNGKTTTTALAGHLLKECGIPCQVGGNIGTPVTSIVDSSADQQWNVLELSSFQLETISHFHARISVCLNVTPDHLDRHKTFERYAGAKARLFETQAEQDAAVLNYEDSECRQFANRTKAEVFWFSSRQRVSAGMWFDGENLIWEEKPFLSRSRIHLRGQHNVENVMAAATAARLAGADAARLAQAVETFPGVEHRLEFVRSVNGVEYYNDSKATNVDSTQKALDAFAGSLWVILGGRDKASDYRPLGESLRTKAKAVLLIGEAAPIIQAQLTGQAQLAGFPPMTTAGKLDTAVEYAHENAKPGDVVLLSPACASFDQFDNFEHRGRVFKQLVGKL
jgi:UDP-N-acetylmuramoylalanine--D-glutamate ligase